MKKDKRKPPKKGAVKVTESSGNVFRDLGFSGTVADLLLVKSEMLAEVATLIEDQGLSQVKAAERLGVDQPTLSKALNGKLTSVSVDRIFEWLNKLGCAVRIDTVKMSAGKKRGVYIEHRAHN